MIHLGDIHMRCVVSQSHRFTRYAPRAAAVVLAILLSAVALAEEKTDGRTYENRLRRIESPQPILADYPEFIEPVREMVRYEAPTLLDDDAADIDVRAWRFSYNARGIIEM